MDNPPKADTVSYLYTIYFAKGGLLILYILNKK
jgi:hypothetical protein